MRRKLQNLEFADCDFAPKFEDLTNILIFSVEKATFNSKAQVILAEIQ